MRSTEENQALFRVAGGTYVPDRLIEVLQSLADFRSAARRATA